MNLQDFTIADALEEGLDNLDYDQEQSLKQFLEKYKEVVLVEKDIDVSVDAINIKVVDGALYYDNQILKFDDELEEMVCVFRTSSLENKVEIKLTLEEHPVVGKLYMCDFEGGLDGIAPNQYGGYIVSMLEDGYCFIGDTGLGFNEGEIRNEKFFNMEFIYG